jgi:hypothetical protein
MRQLRESGAYLRPATGARATITMIFMGRTLAADEPFFHSRCKPEGQYGLFRGPRRGTRVRHDTAKHGKAVGATRRSVGDTEDAEAKSLGASSVDTSFKFRLDPTVLNRSCARRPAKIFQKHFVGKISYFPCRSFARLCCDLSVQFAINLCLAEVRIRAETIECMLAAKSQPSHGFVCLEPTDFDAAILELR